MDRSSLLVRSFAVVAGLLAFPAAAQTPSPISACYNTTNGALRVVASAADCRTAERFVTWSAGGGTGPQGDVGPSGGGIDKSRVYQRIAFVDVVRDFATTAEAD